MSVLGIIPARAGSERCPGKNMAVVGGKSLIERAVDAAQASNIFDRLVISTDLPLVGPCDIISRPPELATAQAEMIDVVRHVAKVCPGVFIVLLQPTSPFRTALDIIEAYNLLYYQAGTAVVSVTEPQKDSVFAIGHAGRLRPYTGSGVVVPNGALYLITRAHLEAGGDWYNGITYAYSMPKSRSLDIDTPLDLEIARMMVKERAAA